MDVYKVLLLSQRMAVIFSLVVFYIAFDYLYYTRLKPYFMKTSKQYEFSARVTFYGMVAMLILLCLVKLFS